MPLTWDVSKLKHEEIYRELSKIEFMAESRKTIFANPRHYDEERDKYYELNTETNMMIFICGLFCGIPIVTEDNYKKLFDRIRFSEITQGSNFLSRTNPKTNKSEGYPITLDMVKKHIGLETNGQRMTKQQFLKRVTNGWNI